MNKKDFNHSESKIIITDHKLNGKNFAFEHRISTIYRNNPLTKASAILLKVIITYNKRYT